MDAFRRISLALSGATSLTKRKLLHLNDDDDEDHTLLSDLYKKPKLNHQDNSFQGDDDFSHIQVKDLRTRRVYSPQSPAADNIPHSSPNLDSGEAESKDEIDSILRSISEKNGDVCCDGDLRTTEKETESSVVGLLIEDQNIGTVSDESVGNDGFERDDNVNVNGVPQLNTPPVDVEMCGKVKPVETIYVTDSQMAGLSDGKVEESFGPNAGEKDDSLRSKQVLRPRLQRKLFKSPGSVSYKRMLPYIMNMMKDDSGGSIHSQNDGKVNDAKQFQLPLSSLSQEALKEQQRTDSRPRNENDESRVVTNKSNSSGKNGSKLTSKDLPESPKQLNAKEMVHDCSSVPSVNGHVEISLEYSNNIRAEEVVGVRFEKDVANAVPSNIHDCKEEAIVGVDTSEKPCILNQQCFDLPDADICGESKSAPFSTDVANTFDSTPNNRGNAGEGFCSNATKGKYNALKSKSMLKPCLQKKLFRTPGSVSYKRMLPFIKDIASDDCGVQKVCQDQKDQRGLRSQPSLVSPSRESPIDELKTDTCPVHDPVDEANAAQESVPKDTLINGDCNSGCSPELPNPVAKIDSPLSSSSPVTNGLTPGEHPSSDSLQLSVYAEAKRDDSSNGEMHHNTDLCYQMLKTKTLERNTTPTVGLKKGILKRNPRGCRGLCTCLSCASFRLNADKAFEFSKNLFLEAQDVALDLMNELSHLRSILERRTNDANNHSVFDENEVREACRKAFTAEQLAKERLCEMNDDVNIHCRITSLQHPRVKFANYIEEKVMSPDRLSEHN